MQGLAGVSGKAPPSPPRGGPGGTMYGLKNAKISFLGVQPHIIVPIGVQGGETTYLSEPHLLSYLLSSESKKNIEKFTFSDLRGYPDRRPPPRLPQGPYRYWKGVGDHEDGLQAAGRP